MTTLFGIYLVSYLIDQTVFLFYKSAFKMVFNSISLHLILDIMSTANSVLRTCNKRVYLLKMSLLINAPLDFWQTSSKILRRHHTFRKASKYFYFDLHCV